VPNALRAAGVNVVRYCDHFADGVHDEVWIPQVVAKGWVILTLDQNFRYKYNEQEAMVQSGATVFVFTGAQMKGSEAAAVLVRCLPRMERILLSTSPPFVAAITKAGEVEVRWPKEKRPLQP
jgi:hypothetical protein